MIYWYGKSVFEKNLLRRVTSWLYLFANILSDLIEDNWILICLSAFKLLHYHMSRRPCKVQLYTHERREKTGN